jgi:hypothetical protein
MIPSFIDGLGSIVQSAEELLNMVSSAAREDRAANSAFCGGEKMMEHVGEEESYRISLLTRIEHGTVSETAFSGAEPQSRSRTSNGRPVNQELYRASAISPLWATAAICPQVYRYAGFLNNAIM